MKTVTLPRWVLAGLAVLFAAGTATGVIIGTQEPELRVIKMCELPGANCPSLCTGPTCPDVSEMIFCCDYGTGDCTLVEALSDCHPEHEYVMICEWGRSLVGGGMECYD
jgi:hypothetical protein